MSEGTQLGQESEFSGKGQGAGVRVGLEGGWWALSGCRQAAVGKPSREGAGPQAVGAVPKLLEESG